MIIDEWLVSKIQGSTSIEQFTTRVYPNFIPQSQNSDIGSKTPCIVYTSIGFNRNRNNRNQIYSLTSVHKSKSNAENLNDQLYTLFDNSTTAIRESSSNISVHNVEIINNAVGLYDEENKYWTKVLDISLWYTK